MYWSSIQLRLAHTLNRFLLGQRYTKPICANSVCIAPTQLSWLTTRKTGQSLPCTWNWLFLPSVSIYMCVCVFSFPFFCVCVFKHWLSLTLGGRDDKSFPHDSLQWIGYDFYLFSEAWWWWWRPWRRLRHDAPVAFTHKLKRRRRKKKRSRDRLKKAFTSDCQHFYYAISFIYILDYKPHPPSSSQSHFFFFSIINSSFFFLFKFAEFEYEFTPTPDGVVSRVRRAH